MERQVSDVLRPESTDDLEADDREILNDLPIGIIIHRDGELLYANPAAGVIAGVDGGERLVGRSLFEFLPRDEWRVIKERMQCLQEEGLKLEAYPFTVQRPDGRRALIRAIPRPVVFRGQPAVQVLIRDVTEELDALEAVRRKDEELSLLLKQVPAVLWSVDRDLKFTVSLGAGLEALDLEPGSVLGMTLYEFFGTDDPEYPSIRHHREALAGASPVYDDAFADRSYRVRLQPLRNPSGEVQGVVGVAFDLTDLRRAQRERAESELRYRHLFEDSRDAIYVTDVAGSILDMNRAGYRLLGLSSETVGEVRAQTLYVDPTERRAFQEVIERQGSVAGFPVRLKAQSGEILDCELTAVVRRNSEGETIGYQGIIRDVTERRRFEEQLQRRALHDPLTDLPNRTLFWDRVEQTIARTQREGGLAAVLFLDLDRFKVVNDGLGHRAGDQILTQVADRLRVCVRELDTVARVGGDEFTILLQGLRVEEEATEVAERVALSMERDFTFDGQPLHVGASIGVAIFDGDAVRKGARADEQADVLIRNADFAMYRAKRRPGSQYAMFDLSQDAAGGGRLQRERELRRAVREEQFVVHYQPIVSLATGRIDAVEPLVRWRHPERGLVQPAEFLGLAQETGLILGLDAWVLEEACRQFARWLAGPIAGRRLQLHPNLSASQFENPKLLDELEGIVQRTGVAPRAIELEVTEHVVTQAPERTRELKRMGFGIAVDDFGRGYSSLMYLKRLAIDTLKIDRGFVQGIGRDREDEAIVRTILALGTTLGLDVVAEGIETEEQLTWLRETACGWGQGFLFAEPMPAVELGELLKRDPQW